MHFSAIVAQAFFGIIVLQLPGMGHCDSPSSWVKSLFEAKGKNINDVAVKVAQVT